MKLLLDANLSPKLVNRLSGLFRGSGHVFDAGMVGTTSDERIWDYTKTNSFAIVIADSDFLKIAEAVGSPPNLSV